MTKLGKELQIGASKVCPFILIGYDLPLLQFEVYQNLNVYACSIAQKSIKTNKKNISTNILKR